MPLFTVKRTTPPGASEAELEAMGFRAVYCAGGIAGLSWRRSYSDGAQGVSLCIYQASDVTDIWAHARAARLSCDEVRLVTEHLPTSPAIRDSAAPDYPLFLATRHLPLAADEHLEQTATLADRTPEIEWIRSLWDNERKVIKTVYRTERLPLLEQRLSAAGLPYDDIAEVEEALPSSFGGLAATEPVAHGRYGRGQTALRD